MSVGGTAKVKKIQDGAKVYCDRYVRYIYLYMCYCIIIIILSLQLG